MQQTNRCSFTDLVTAKSNVLEYFNQLKKTFISRDNEIDLIMYALLSMQHVLFFGPPGTSKTLLIDTTYNGFDNAKQFSIEMTQFMAEDSIFGPYNIKKMREEGVLEHNTAGMLPEATVARIGEGLDANPAVLRSMLGALNERRFIRGKQRIDMPLHTAYVDTNIDPYKYLQQFPNSWAFFDRIAFIGSTNYLTTADEIVKMVHNYQSMILKVPSKKLDFNDINLVVQYIVNPPSLWTNSLILKMYAEAIIDYKKQRDEWINNADPEEKKDVIFPQISDRRINIVSHMPEMTAILDGRTEVSIEDLVSCHFSLCTSTKEKEIWKNIINQKIEEYNKQRENDLARLQQESLSGILDTLNKIDLDENMLQQDGVNILQSTSITLHMLRERSEQINPEGNDEIEKLKQDAINKVQEKLELVKTLLTKILKLPS